MRNQAASFEKLQHRVQCKLRIQSLIEHNNVIYLR
jgi:hypothetical protein